MAFSALEALQAFGAGRQMALEDRRIRTRQEAGSRAASGDYSGAANVALSGGEYDLAGQLRQLNDQQRTQALQEATILADEATRLRRLPAEQRQSAFASLRPHLQQFGFFGDHELDNVDLSDAGLEGYIATGNSALRVLRPRSEQNPPEVQRNYDFYRSQFGEDVARQYIQRQTEPTPIASRNDDGTFTIIPRPSMSPATATPSQPSNMSPDQLRAAAADAIRRGADPTAVEAELQRMLGGGDTRAPNDPAPAFHPAPGGAGPQGPRTFR